MCAKSLTQDDINHLEELKNYGDAGAYYDQLADWGYKYGDLAAGVVRDSPMSGTMANAFMAETACQDGISINITQARGIRISLMEADFRARAALDSSVRSGQRPISQRSSFCRDFGGLDSLSDFAAFRMNGRCSWRARFH